MRRITKFKRSVRAVSPVIAVLLMIAIAVVASLIAYAWVIGFIGGTTTKASNSMLIQSTSHTGGASSVLVVYVQNVGQGPLQLKQTQSVYVNSVLKGITDSTPPLSTGMVSFSPGTTTTLTTDYPYTPNEKLKIKVVATDGTFAEYTQTGTTGETGTTSGTFGPHTITVTQSANGLITPGTGPVNHGTDKTYTITGNSGYLVSDVRIDGVSIGSRASYTFVGVASDHTISAAFTPISANNHVIHASAGAHGQIVPPGDIAVQDGSNQVFTITPDSHYHIADVLVDGVSVGAVTSYLFSNVNADHTISATFAIDTLIITASAGTNGQISPSGSTTVNYGADQTFNIQPNTGYLVADVLVDGSSVGSRISYTFTNVVASHTISASFAVIPQNTFVIQASTSAHGIISPVGSVVVNPGSNQAFTITPDSHYHIADVLVDGVSVGAVTSYLFSNVNADHAISATFAVDTLTVTASSGTHGRISPAGPITVDYGTDQAFTIIPDSGYQVGNVLVDGGSVGSPVTYTLTNIVTDHTISATFTATQSTYTIQASAGANGAISPTGSVVVNYGGNQAFTITPTIGYHVANVLVDGASVGAVTSYTFSNVVAGHTIAATFAINQYTITVNQGSNGVIAPGTTIVNYGASQTFTITPNTGYHVADVTVDGSSKGAVTAWTFSNVQVAHTITASFASGTYHTITASAGANGQISPSGSVAVLDGASQTFTITPNSGYVVASLLVDGVSAGYGQSYTFTNVVADHTMMATFTSGSTLINTGFDSTPWDAGWMAGGNPPWYAASGQGIGGSNAAKSDPAGSNSGPFTSDRSNTQNANIIRITFMYKVLNTNSANDLRLAYSYHQNPNLNPYPNSDFVYFSGGSIGRPAQDGIWYVGSVTIARTTTPGAITDPNAFTNNFYFRFESTLSTNPGGLAEQVWIDNVIITIST